MNLLIGILTDMDGYDTDVAGYLRIETFPMASATIAFGQSTVTHGCLRIGLSCLSVMNRTYSGIVRVCIIVSVRLKVTRYYVA